MIDQIKTEDIIDIAKEAGSAIMHIYSQEFAFEKKKDQTPLTQADRNSNTIITSRLQKLYPGIPYISEETKLTPYKTRKEWTYFWLIDPLDGTKEFIKKNDEFSVNIALIYKTLPILGVIYAPAQNITFYAKKNYGSFKIEGKQRPIRIQAKRTIDTKKLVIVGSRSHSTSELYEFLEKMRKEYVDVEFIAAGSSLKFCLIAEGKADIYPRTGPTMEWDTAAGHALVLESGKQVFKFNSNDPLEYNKKDLTNGWFIVR